MFYGWCFNRTLSIYLWVSYSLRPQSELVTFKIIPLSLSTANFLIFLIFFLSTLPFFSSLSDIFFTFFRLSITSLGAILFKSLCFPDTKWLTWKIFQCQMLQGRVCWQPKISTILNLCCQKVARLYVILAQCVDLGVSG